MIPVRAQFGIKSEAGSGGLRLRGAISDWIDGDSHSA
jgi:hypothetical protein